MRARFKNMLRVIVFAFVCAILLGVLYVIYINYVKNGPEIKVVNDLSINYKDGRLFRVKKEKSFHFSIINNSSSAKYYYIELNGLKNYSDGGYNLTDNSNLSINNKFANNSVILADYILIDANESVDYILTITNDSNKTLSGEINIDVQLLSTNNFADVIIQNNNVKFESVTAIGKEEAVTNEGLIKITSNNNTIYYFRGKIDNNYVEINDMLFRIVKINSDRSVSLVLDGITDSLKKYYEDVNNFSFKNSELMTYLEDWLNTNLYDYTGFITSYRYCDDTVMSDNNIFNSFNRIKKDNIYSYVCLGNEVLSKIGLLTADDVIFAGGTLNNINKDFYLYNSNITSQYYLMTGATYSNKTFYPFIVSTDGKIINNVPGAYLRGIRPVITIAKTVNVEGSGTVNDPYKLTK